MSNLSNLRPITTIQYDECKSRARSRVERNIGERPARSQFARELGRLWTPLDLIALVVFIPALFVSSVHIVTHMGKLAASSYQAANLAQAGIVIDQATYVTIHQLALIPLAEGSMILFMVMFGLSAGWRRWVYLGLAAVALVFVSVANIQSEIGTLEAVLAPIFTIGIGLKLEHLIVQSITRRSEVDKRYLEALHTWELATKEPTAHPDYKAFLYNEIWQQLMKTKSNQWALEAPNGFKVSAVRRELERDSWAHEQVEPVAEFNAAAQPVEVAEQVDEQLPFGSTAATPEESGSMPMMLSVNGHGIGATNN